MKLDMEPHDLWLMLLSTIRYSLGRMSAMPSEAQRLVREYGQMLTLDQKKQIVQEVYEALDNAVASGVFLGMEFDHDGWQRFADDLERQLSVEIREQLGRPSTPPTEPSSTI